jgi:hypothetical protein
VNPLAINGTDQAAQNTIEAIEAKTAEVWFTLRFE